MNIGMLWFDNDTKTDLPAKVQRAADYYRDKYGRTPNLCFVHPSMVVVPAGTAPRLAGGVELRTSRAVLPNHLWLGVSTQTT
jgi:hypothetical protein